MVTASMNEWLEHLGFLIEKFLLCFFFFMGVQEVKML